MSTPTLCLTLRDSSRAHKSVSGSGQRRTHPIGNWHLDEPRFEQRTSDCVHPREPVLNLLTASRRRDLGGRPRRQCECC